MKFYIGILFSLLFLFVSIQIYAKFYVRNEFTINQLGGPKIMVSGDVDNAKENTKRPVFIISYGGSKAFIKNKVPGKVPSRLIGKVRVKIYPYLSRTVCIKKIESGKTLVVKNLGDPKKNCTWE